jgi:hypothetical protein
LAMQNVQNIQDIVANTGVDPKCSGGDYERNVLLCTA